MSPIERTLGDFLPYQLDCHNVPCIIRVSLLKDTVVDTEQRSNASPEEQLEQGRSKNDKTNRSYRTPNMNIIKIPILRLVGSCSPTTATIGITRRTVSIPSPTAEMGTASILDFASSSERACSSHV